LTWDAADRVAYAQVQAPMCEVDEYVGTSHADAVRRTPAPLGWGTQDRTSG